MRTTAFVLGFAMALSVSPRLADACGNPVYLNTKKATKLVAKAEQALTEGKSARVVALLDPEEMFQYTGRLWIDADDDALMRRAGELLYVAAIRIGHKRADAAEARFLDIFSEDRDDPWLRARAAEVMVRLHRAEKIGEALEILADLESRDLMPDPEAWGVLAWLRLNAGDDDGSARATAACRAMTELPALCDPAKVGADLARSKKKLDAGGSKKPRPKAKKPAPEA